MRLRLALLIATLVAAAGCGGDPIVPVDATPDADMTDAEDVDPPETTIDDGPAALVNRDMATITFSSDENGTFKCRLDGGAETDCTSPRMLTNLTDGGHTFEVRAVDTSNLSDPTPAVHMWRVDTVDPDTQITAAPPAIDNSTTATLEFDAPGEVNPTFECSIDGSVFAACTSPFTTPTLNDGNHIFRVRAIDQAGNADPTTANANWVVDTVSPDTVIDAGPAGVVNTRSATFTFSSPGFMPGYTFDCRLDTAPFAPCTSPRQFSGLLDGAHAFEVRVTDELGNPDPSPARRQWTVDATGPTTSITVRPDNPSGDTTPTFEFTANEQATFECQIDGLIPYAPCVSPSTTAALPAGIRFFRVRATDTIGNVGPEATYEWVIDASGPTVTITTGPSGPVASTTATFNWNSSEPATFCYRFTGDAADTCTMGLTGSGTVTRPGLTQGEQTFTITATDGLGNAGAPTVRNFSVDTVGPAVVIMTGPSNTVGTVANQFVFTAAEPATFCHKVDTLGEVCTQTPALTSSVTINAIDGAHTLQVVARDALLNRTAMPVVRNWTIDTVRPTTTISAGPDQGSFDGDGDATVDLTASEPSTICWKLGVAGMETCSAAGQMTFSANLMGMTDGVVNFIATSRDAIGAGPSVTRTWTVDSVRPTVMITSGPADASTVGLASATFGVTSSEASRICWQFNSDPEVCSSAGVVTFSPSKAGLPQGPNTFAVHAEDAIGAGAALMRTWTVDTVRPTITINSGPAQGSTTAAAVSMLSVASSESSTICWRFDGGAESCSAAGVMSADITSPALTDGGHVIDIYGKDTIGTGPSNQRSWTVDGARPTITINAGPAQNSFQGSQTVSFSVASSERATICWQFNGGAPTCTPPGALTAVASATGLAEGAASFSVTGADVVGQGAATVRNWTIDLTRPTMSFTAGPNQNSTINATMASFTATASEASTICWRLDGGVETCTAAGQMMTSIDVMMLAQGPHTVSVVGRDTVGSGPVLNRNFNVDTVRPVATITGGPAQGSTANSTSPTFVVASSEASQICWKFNGGVETCTPGNNVTTANAPGAGLPQGMNMFEARAIDFAGTGATVTRTWFVDTQAPTVMITAGPDQGSVQPTSNHSFTVSASEASLICWRFNNGPQACSQPAQMMVTFVSGPLPAGPNVLAVNAFDGNGPGPTVLRTWSNDTARPTVSITSGPAQNDKIDSANVSFGISASEPSTICWQFDGAPEDCTPPGQTVAIASKLALAEGNHVFTVKASDAVGAGPIVTRNWLVDTIPATITILSPTQGQQTSEVSPAITITTNEPATICWKLDGVNPATCSAPGAVMIVANLMNLTEGNHALEVTATDQVAHLSSLTRNWTVDTTAPTPSFVAPSPAAAAMTGPAVDFKIDSNEAATICYTLDGGAEMCSAAGVVTFSFSLIGLPVGAHTLVATARDAANNLSAEIARSWTSAAAKLAGPALSAPIDDLSGTLSFWVRDPGTAEGDILTLSASGGGCTLRGIGALVGLECRRGRDSIAAAYGMLGSLGKSDGQWHLVTIAFEGDAAELWIDGELSDRTGTGLGAVAARGFGAAAAAGGYQVDGLRSR